VALDPPPLPGGVCSCRRSPGWPAVSCTTG